MDIFPNRKVPLRHRLALYLPIAGLVLAMIVVTWIASRLGPLEEDQAWTNVDFAALPEVDLLRRYIRIDTSATTGSEIAGAEFLAAELERIGLEPTIETFGDRHANVWAILEGKSPEALVLHNHIDVYPIEDPEAWDYDPYGAEIDEAWVYGRGVFDMKSLAIVQLLTLEEIIKSGRKPEKSIIFLATGSEEVGSELGVRWILEKHPELAERFWVALTEGGVVEPLSRWDIKYWGIEFGQKQFAYGYLCSESREKLDNLRQQILTWQHDNEELIVAPGVRAFGTAYSPSRVDPLYQAILADPRPTLLDGPNFERVPPYLKSLYRNEIVFFNTEPAPGGGFRGKLIVHLLPGQDFEAVRPHLLPDWLVGDVAMTLGPPLGANHASSLVHPAFIQMTAAVQDAYPDAIVGPYLLPWSATDSRFFRQASVDSYGFSPFVIFNTETFRVDGVNERLSLPGYMTGFELYLDAVLRIIS